MKKIALFLVPAALLLLACENRKPVIGISSGVSEGKVSLRDEYGNAVCRAGGIPVIIPVTTDSTIIGKYAGIIDGLIMSGGEDIQPAYYGEEVFNGTVECVARRDTADFLLLRAALRRGLPVLAICRGEQLANVLFGGSLYQDLPSQLGTAVCHSQDKKRDCAEHTVYLEEGSRLRGLLGVDSIGVNSFHHQAVRTLGEGLKVSARAADGVIEAFEGKGVFGVQFHPEAFVSAGDDTFLPIFTDFVEQASRHGQYGF